MKLWLVKRTQEAGYDNFRGFVVRAESGQRTWQIVSDEQRSLEWESLENNLTPEEWSITELDAEGSPGIILYDFLHG